MGRETELEGQALVDGLLRTGVINLDKPQGPTSHQISAWVKQILGIDRVGHAGTLDPNVTGVLVIGLDRATRALDVLLEHEKEYVGIMHLHRHVKRKALDQVFKEFTGKIYQTPPVRAAVKRQRRVREIYELELLELDGRSVLFRTVCESGTYIRTLCTDMGEALGVGANMLELRRTRTAHFREAGCVRLQDLKDAFVTWQERQDPGPLSRIVQPMESLLSETPRLVVKDTAVDAICHGADLAPVGIEGHQGTIQRGATVAIMTKKGEAVALAKSMHNFEKPLPAKGWVAEVYRVLMEPGTYPKGWRTKAAK